MLAARTKTRVTSTQVLARTPQSDTAPRYSLLLSTEPDEVRAAQRLRHRVFADELGAVLHTSEPGLDVDRFDAFCDHMLVREENTGEIVGNYRMLPPAAAARAGGLYSEGEFVLDELAPLRSSLVETGRSCVHPDHRSGASSSSTNSPSEYSPPARAAAAGGSIR